MKKSRRPAVRLLCGLAAALALAAGGCSTGDVSGTVRFNGKPLPKGRVTFVSQKTPGVSLSAPIAEDGGYRIAGCPAGPVKITVQTVVPRSGGVRPGTKAAQAVPACYADADRSDLEYNVTRGPQTHDIDLRPDGSAPAQRPGRR